MHQLTDLPDEVERIPEYAARNNRIRTEGIRILLAAARAAGATRFLVQSIAWTPPAGGQAGAEHERLVLAVGGVVLRYGAFYGPGTYSGTDRTRLRYASTSARRRAERWTPWRRLRG